MSGLSSNSDNDNDDEPIYFTPTHEPEDLICEGSDAEANAKAIIRKRQRYEKCAERVLRGQLPIIQSAQLRGPFNKDNKNEWVNPWRHRERDWWKPGSKDMLFRREDVMRRAREHGRTDMSPTEALAWCRRDAKRQAKRRGIEDDSKMEQIPATRQDRERLVVDDTVYGDITLEEEKDIFERDRSLTGLPFAQVPESTSLTHTNIKNSEGTPGIGGSISNQGDYGRQPDTWTGIKRPVDAAWLKGSHISKRSRWEDPAVSSPTPLPHAIGQKFQQKVTGTTIIAHNRTTNTVQPRSSSSLKIQQDPTSPRKSYASLQQPGTTFDTEASFHNNIGQQGQERNSISVFGSGRKSANLYGDSPDPHSSVLSQELGSKPASPLLPSATHPVTSPRLPLHPRTGAIYDETQRTPGNISFVTDIAPSSVNLEKFQFRKKRRRKTDAQEFTHHSLKDIGENSRVPSSEGSMPDSGLQSDGILSNPSILHPSDTAKGSSLSPNRCKNSSITKGSSHKSSRVDESWLTTQEEVATTPSTRNSDGKRVIEGEYSPLRENFDNSWVTTQEDFDHFPKSSASMDITQIYRGSSFLPGPSLVEHMAVSSPRNYERTGSLESSPHLPALLKDSNKQGVPYYNLNGSSTQSYNTTPVSSINNKLRSPQTRVPQQNSRASQQLNDHTTSISNKEFAQNTRNDNPESSISENIPVSDDNKVVEKTEAISKINMSFRSEQIEEITVLQVQQELDINTEIQADREAPDVNKDAEEVPGVAQGKMEEEVQEAMRGEPHADDVPNSAFSSGHTSTSSSPARTNNLTIHNLTPIQKARNVDRISRSSLSNQFTPSMPSGEDIISPASTQDLTEHSSKAAASEGNVAIPSGDTESSQGLDSEPQLKEPSASQYDCPQSPWAPVEALPLVAHRIPTATEMIEPHSDVEFPHPGWQKEERPVTPDNDVIRPFRDLMTPSPPPEALNTLGVEQGPSHTQLLVEAATHNPWVNGSKKKSTKRKQVSFSVLDEEDAVQSQPRSRRQRRSPSLENTYRTGACGSKVAEFDDGITNINSFQSHFSAIRKNSKGDGVPKRNSVKRPLSTPNCKTSLLGATDPIVSSPAIDAMAEAFIAADRESTRERNRRLTTSPLRNRNPKSQSYTTFQDDDGDDSGIQPSSFHSAAHAALNETSSNAKVGDHTPGDYLDEVEGFLGGDWSVEGELKKAISTEFEMVSSKGEGNVHSRGSLLGLEENVWS